MSNVMVTKEIAFVGMKVIKGRDWIYGDQDRSSAYGEIIAVDTSGWTRVKWSNGSTHIYRMGYDDKYDLYLYKPALHARDLKVDDWVGVIDMDAYYIRKNSMILGEKYQIFSTNLGEAKEYPNGTVTVKKSNGTKLPYSIGVHGLTKVDAPAITSPIVIAEGGKVRCKSRTGTDTLSTAVKIGDVYTVRTLGSERMILAENDRLVNVKDFEPITIIHADFAAGTYDWGRIIPKVGDIIVRIGTSTSLMTGYGYTVESCAHVDLIKVAECKTESFSLKYFAPIYAVRPSDYKGLAPGHVPKVDEIRESLNNINSQSYGSRTDTNTGYKVRRPVSTIERGKGRTSTPIRCGRSTARSRCCNPGH